MNFKFYSTFETGGEKVPVKLKVSSKASLLPVLGFNKFKTLSV